MGMACLAILLHARYTCALHIGIFLGVYGRVCTELLWFGMVWYGRGLDGMGWDGIAHVDTGSECSHSS
jgi:hypothetical protein